MSTGEMQLADYPEWGLDIMRGLYGCDAVEAECARGRRRRPVHCEPVPPLSPLQAELEALDAVGELVVSFVRRRVAAHRRRTRVH
ncbi:hypothetical protein GYA93_00050 [Gordonia desulfuricans]|uniref:Uncharacterized protein n=1 Tax=Gordonia desulfuricans TaxID=89051 RepID=A0A7K3LI88_9ACTN|nr:MULTISPECIES: hypothetical protein [Gordonia]KOY48955.1 hypothetical protein ISGA_13250 [Gordonia sp. NB41Y]NDK87979.1 hypothetical protein [Gordonia desulfuricans]WLP89969.1 hypothetical protein Q9K23_20920 [Gordonia sp. NB41Y]